MGIKIPQTPHPPYDNSSAHNQLKILMKQKKIIDVKVDNQSNVWISSYPVTRLRYQITDNGWKWIISYLKSGDYEDFGVNPSEVPVDMDFIKDEIKKMIEDPNINILRVPFLRETQARIKLIIPFPYGKLHFELKMNDDLLIYLKENKRYEGDTD